MDKKVPKNLLLETRGQIPLLNSLMTQTLKLFPFSTKTNLYAKLTTIRTCNLKIPRLLPLV